MLFLFINYYIIFILSDNINSIIDLSDSFIHKVVDRVSLRHPGDLTTTACTNNLFPHINRAFDGFGACFPEDFVWPCRSCCSYLVNGMVLEVLKDFNNYINMNKTTIISNFIKIYTNYNPEYKIIWENYSDPNYLFTADDLILRNNISIHFHNFNYTNNKHCINIFFIINRFFGEHVEAKVRKKSFSLFLTTGN